MGKLYSGEHEPDWNESDPQIKENLRRADDPADEGDLAPQADGPEVDAPDLEEDSEGNPEDERR